MQKVSLVVFLGEPHMYCPIK